MGLAVPGLGTHAPVVLVGCILGHGVARIHPVRVNVHSGGEVSQRVSYKPPEIVSRAFRLTINTRLELLATDFTGEVS